MSRFYNICLNCGKISNSQDSECEYCGSLKTENILETNLSDSIEEDVTKAMELNDSGKIILSIFH